MAVVAGRVMISNIAPTPKNVRNQKASLIANAIARALRPASIPGMNTNGILRRGAIQLPRYSVANMPMPEYTSRSGSCQFWPAIARKATTGAFSRIPPQAASSRA